MTGVQLIGKKAVLDRFATFDCDGWALYQGKQFIVGGCGVEDLDNWLTSFSQSGTTAAYTIRVYNTETVPTSSTANTDYIACIGFRLVDNYEGMGIAGHSIGLMERIKGIEKRLDEQGDEEENDENSLDKVIMGWLTDPAKLAQVAGVIKMFTGGGAPVQAVPAIQGIGTVQEEESTKEVDINKLAAALDVLGAKDPKIVEHLEKLSRLSVNDPDLFKSVISKLDLL